MHLSAPPGIAPNITRGPQDSTVIDGMSVILNCETSGAPRPAITWQKGKGDGDTSPVSACPSLPGHQAPDGADGFLVPQGSGSWPAARCSSRASRCWSRAACS